MAGLGKARCGRRGGVRHGSAGRGMVRHGRSGGARFGKAGYGMAGRGEARHGLKFYQEV